MSSPDDIDTEDLLAALRDKWGEEKKNWLPSQSLMRYKSSAEWPPCLIKALFDLAIRTRTVKDRDFVVEQLKEMTYASLHRNETPQITLRPSLTPEEEAHQLSRDAQSILASLRRHFNAVDKLVKHWGEGVESGLPYSATLDSSALGWDVKLLRRMAKFAAAYPNASRVMKEFFVVGAIKDREERNGDASRKVTLADFKHAQAHFKKSKRNGDLKDLEDAMAELDEEEAMKKEKEERLKMNKERFRTLVGLPERYVADLLAVPWDESKEDSLLQRFLKWSMEYEAQLRGEDAARTASRRARRNRAMYEDVRTSDAGQNETSESTAGGSRDRSVVRHTPAARPQDKRVTTSTR
ncbi:uncharacterized protein LTHEOB_4076 [Lasiodiplodia theobromae]|uniref:uncharacterized protein n=1 Tax=Lasiodiplodia theobromae TaxID=45133 RepID=UPI0015C2CDA7|nr:uncharacterized protein LTHEOB_4076 [Lasiodiplodia theobromae]KAF4546768.1 hypothetical protein LTHEOB_4076 [Lasiodiplodia theobromae]